MTKFLKPAYEVTIGSSYWNIIKNRDNANIQYEDEVLEIPSIKTLGLVRTQSETKVHASGVVYDYLSQVTGAEITLGTVALPDELMNQLEGANVVGGYMLNKTNDVGKEFAFGYWGENSDGTYVYYWHPVCKLVPSDETHATKTDEALEPSREFKIVVIPYNGLWRVKYSTKLAEQANEPVLTIDEFFSKPIYQDSHIISGGSN